MSAPLSLRPEVVALPSLPPSPSFLEEVFSHPRPWSIRRSEEFDLRDSRRSFSPGSTGSSARGKGKQTLEDMHEDDDEDTQHPGSTHEVYPPMSDEAAETRRVEETLKRWELAERRRRKSIRESTQHSSGPSLFSSVTRAFKSHESVDVAREGYAVPLDDIDHSRDSPRDVAVHSPGSSTFNRSTSLDRGSGTGTSQNPFVHPSERPYTPTLTPVTPTPTLIPPTPPSPTPFANERLKQALQADPSASVSAKNKTHARKRSSRTEAFLPPPRPVGLPPSPGERPRMTPLEPTSQPVLQPPRHEGPEEREEVRWWHDWLCACGEGPDRGGDNQAGHTNPFE